MTGLFLVMTTAIASEIKSKSEAQKRIWSERKLTRLWQKLLRDSLDIADLVLACCANLCSRLLQEYRVHFMFVLLLSWMSNDHKTSAPIFSAYLHSINHQLLPSRSKANLRNIKERQKINCCLINCAKIDCFFQLEKSVNLVSRYWIQLQLFRCSTRKIFGEESEES